jgi:23S rRNA-/tRNA-specific pseudouridylate synthase
MYSVVSASPITGRTHQLRVHFSHIGHPICGDTLYGYPSQFINRQALHAYKLIFDHPTKNEKITLLAPPPKDITDFINIAFPYEAFDIKNI